MRKLEVAKPGKGQRFGPPFVPVIEFAQRR